MGDLKIQSATQFKKTWNRYFPGILVAILPMVLCLGVTNFALMPAIMFPVFISLMLLLNTLFYKGTESIEFNNGVILVNKKKIFKFTVEEYTIQKFRYKTNWEGLKISSDLSIVYVYETDFEQENWKIIFKRLSSKGKIKKELIEFYGNPPKDELIREKVTYIKY